MNQKFCLDVKNFHTHKTQVYLFIHFIFSSIYFPKANKSNNESQKSEKNDSKYQSKEKQNTISTNVNESAKPTKEKQQPPLHNEESKEQEVKENKYNHASEIEKEINNYVASYGSEFDEDEKIKKKTNKTNSFLLSEIMATLESKQIKSAEKNQIAENIEKNNASSHSNNELANENQTNKEGDKNKTNILSDTEWL